MSIRVGTTSRAITACGGAVLLRAAMRAVGLAAAVDAYVHLKQRDRGLREAEFVTGVAESIAVGAGCLDDLAVARADTAQERLRGFAIPAAQTAGRWLRRFTLGHIGQLNKALAEVQRNAFAAGGVGRSRWTSTRPTCSVVRSAARASIAPTRRATRSIRCCASTPSRARRCTPGCDAAKPARQRMKTFLTETLRRVPAGVAVRARLDSGFYSNPLLTQMEQAQVSYLCGVPLIPAILGPCAQIPDECWDPCLDKDEGEVAEFGYRMRDRRQFRRYIVKRIPLEIGRQATLEGGGFRYWVFVTNDHDRSAAELESEHRHKADVESGMRELKIQLRSRRHPQAGLHGQLGLAAARVLAHNLCCWTQHLGRLGGGRDEGELRAKRLRYRYLAVAGIVVNSGHRLTLRLADTYSSSTDSSPRSVGSKESHRHRADEPPATSRPNTRFFNDAPRPVAEVDSVTACYRDSATSNPSQSRASTCSHHNPCHGRRRPTEGLSS